MKTILTLLFLLFSSSIVAEDISDFQIEGMSIGDSLFDYFSEEEIKNNFTEYDYKKVGNLNFITTEFNRHPRLKTYEAIQFLSKENDINYNIFAISAGIFYKGNSISGCYQKLEKVSEELSLLFKYADKQGPVKRTHYSDPTHESHYTGIYFSFKSGDYVSVECFEWSNYMFDKYGNTNSFRISIATEEVGYWVSQQ